MDVSQTLTILILPKEIPLFVLRLIIINICLIKTAGMC